MATQESLDILVADGVVTVEADGTVKLTPKSWCIMTDRPLLHFVGFKDDRYWNAVKTFGKPDFIHRHWDHRARDEMVGWDIVVFANGDETMEPTPFAYDDSAHF